LRLAEAMNDCALAVDLATDATDARAAGLVAPVFSAACALAVDLTTEGGVAARVLVRGDAVAALLQLCCSSVAAGVVALVLVHGDATGGLVSIGPGVLTGVIVPPPPPLSERDTPPPLACGGVWLVGGMSFVGGV